MSEAISGRVHDVSGMQINVLGKKFANTYLANKTNPLTIGTFGVWQTKASCEIANLCLADTADGEEREIELFPRETREKIGLVFRFIQTLSQEHIGLRQLESSVMSGRNRVKTERFCPLSKDIEFHERIAKHVRIGRESTRIRFGEVAHDPFMVLAPQIEDEEIRDAEILRHSDRFISVDACRTIPIVGDVVFHESCGYLVPGIDEEFRRNGGINATRESDEDFFSCRHNKKEEGVIVSRSFAESNRKFTISRAEN